MADDPRKLLPVMYKQLQARRQDAKKWNDLYEGEHKLRFASPEFSEACGGLFDDFADNWCDVVPDTVCERLRPLGFRLPDGTLDKAAGDAWKRQGCDVEIGPALLDALITSRSFAIAWKKDSDRVDLTFEDSSTAIIGYEPGNRRRPRALLTAHKADGYELATIVTPTDVARFQRKESGEQWRLRTIGLRPGEDPILTNPLGEVPAVELANRSRLTRPPRSELHVVAPLQHTVNTLWAHLLTGADFAALPARVIMGMDRPVRDVIDEESGDVVGTEDVELDTFRRNRFLWLEKQGASIGEFSPANLEAYVRVIELAVQHIAAQTKTPPHYLLGSMVNISADALAAAESGLVAKVSERQRHFGAGLRQLMRLQALAAGDTARAEQLEVATVVWRDPQFRSEAQYADALTKYKAIGVPDEALWERIPDVDLDQVERWKRMRDEAAAASAAAMLGSSFGPKPPVGPEDGEGQDEDVEGAAA